MIEFILSHWATYVFLVWLAVCILGNLLTQQKPGSPPPAAPRYTARRAARVSAAKSVEDERELARHER
jgi:hypothetical protein